MLVWENSTTKLQKGSVQYLILVFVFLISAAAENLLCSYLYFYVIFSELSVQRFAQFNWADCFCFVTL